MANTAFFDATVEGKTETLKSFCSHLAPDGGQAQSNVIIPRIWIYTMNQAWVTDGRFVSDHLPLDAKTIKLGGEAKWGFASSAIIYGPTTVPAEATKNQKEKNVIAVNILKDVYNSFQSYSKEDVEIMDQMVPFLSERIGVDKGDERITFPEKKNFSERGKELFEILENKFSEILEKENCLETKKKRKESKNYYPNTAENYVKGYDTKSLSELEEISKRNDEKLFVSITSLAQIYDLNILVHSEESMMEVYEEIHIDRDGWEDVRN